MPLGFRFWTRVPLGKGSPRSLDINTQAVDRHSPFDCDARIKVADANGVVAVDFDGGRVIQERDEPRSFTHRSGLLAKRRDRAGSATIPVRKDGAGSIMPCAEDVDGHASPILFAAADGRPCDAAVADLKVRTAVDEGDQLPTLVCHTRHTLHRGSDSPSAPIVTLALGSQQAVVITTNLLFFLHSLSVTEGCVASQGAAA